MDRFLKFFFLSLFFVFITFAAWIDLNAEEDLPGKNVEYSPLPSEKEGRYPIEIPQYDGVEQLMVLSNRWVVVATRNEKDVIAKINDLTKGKYLDYVKVWEASKKAGKHDWYVKRDLIEKTLDKYLAEARELAGERKLDQPTYFTITSKTDPNYSKPQHPLRTTRTIVSIDDGEKIPGWNYIDYAHYSYLEFPFPMQNGNRYTITLDNGKKVSFLYDEMHTVSRSIKVNQMGYLPDTPHKYAYLGGYLHEFGPLDFSGVKEFSVISVESGQPVLKGEIKLRAKNPRLAVKPDDHKTDPNTRPLFSGEDIYEIDLSDLKEVGEFFITIPGVGRSWTFRNAPDVYGEAFYIAARGLFHQRCGIAIEGKYSAWKRQICHTEPVYESESVPFITPEEGPKGYDVFDVVGATIDYSRKTMDARGGWHDAADWQRNIFHYADIFDLLGAYEMAPNKFYDGQLHIPESNNGIPDILDEAEYGLSVWKKSMKNNGGVAGLVQTWTEPSIDDPRVHYAYSVRTRWSSLIYSAAAAQFAYLVAPFDKQKAEEYTQSAIKAYEFGIDPKNKITDMTIHAAKNRGSGEKYTLKFTEDDKGLIPFLIMAKLRLFILTGNHDYLKGIPKLLKEAPKPYQYPFSYKDFSPWLYFGLFNEKVTKAFPKLFIEKWRQNYLETVDDLVKMSNEQPYRHSWPADRDYWMRWGATTMTNQAKALLIAYYLTHDQKYRDAALANVDFMLGNNPLGMSWTTGMGFVYPISIQHAVSHDYGILDPVPGIAIYGVIGEIPETFIDSMWQIRKPDGTFDIFQKKENWDLPLWRRFFAHPYAIPGQNEFTIHETMSAGIFTYAMLMPDGWMPSENLKNKKPRKDELLFGYWYLP